MCRRHEVLWRLHEHTQDEIHELEATDPAPPSEGDDWPDADTVLLSTRLGDRPQVAAWVEKGLARQLMLKSVLH